MAFVDAIIVRVRVLGPGCAGDASYGRVRRSVEVMLRVLVCPLQLPIMVKGQVLVATLREEQRGLATGLRYQNGV
jgi:hypothetical protein